VERLAHGDGNGESVRRRGRAANALGRRDTDVLARRERARRREDRADAYSAVDQRAQMHAGAAAHDA
jgi:hypothetical protein